MYEWCQTALGGDGGKRDAAIHIALTARVLRQCEYHPDILLVVDGADEGRAYAIGNVRLKAGEFPDTLDSPTGMASSLKAAIDEHGLERELPRQVDS